jgi:CRISPR-associated protein Csh2
MRNSEILIITEAKNTNPNGDPANENKPRFQDDGTVEITDLRLKRYIRDYINQYEDDLEVAVKSIDEVTETSISSLLKNYNEKMDFDKAADKEKVFLEKYIDIPLFGLVTGSAKHSEIAYLKPNYYGTVQYQYGESLNCPNPKDIDVSPVTGTLGKDYRIDYGVFAFYGVVNQKTAQQYDMMNDELIKKLDQWTIKSIPAISAESRSKIGQDILCYLRIEYRDGNLPHDLRDFIGVGQTNDVHSLEDLDIDFIELEEYISGKLNSIENIYYYNSPKLSITDEMEVEKLKEIDLS